MNKLSFCLIILIYSCQSKVENGCDFELKDPIQLKEAIQLEEAIFRSFEIPEIIKADTFYLAEVGLCGKEDDCSNDDFNIYNLNKLNPTVANKLKSIFPKKIIFDITESRRLIDNLRKTYSDTVDIFQYLFKSSVEISINGKKISTDSVKIFISLYNDSLEFEFIKLFTYKNNKWVWEEAKGRFE